MLIIFTLSWSRVGEHIRYARAATASAWDRVYRQPNTQHAARPYQDYTSALHQLAISEQDGQHDGKAEEAE